MYNCQMCNYKTVRLKLYNTHQYYHRYTLNPRFLCLHVDCCREFQKYRNFKKHLLRIHSQSHLSPQLVSESFNGTQYCNVVGCGFSGNTRKIFLSHICQHIKNNIIVTCPHHDCRTYTTIFKNVATIRSHFYRKHSEESFVTRSTDTESPDINDLNGQECADNLDVPIVNIETNNDCLDETYCDILSTLYLTLQSKHFLTDSALQLIISGISDLNEVSNQKLTSALLKENFIIPPDILKNNLFHQFHNLNNGPMRTTYCRKQFSKKHYHFVSPICVPLVNDEHSSAMYYVPIIDTVKALLSNKSFLNSCLINNVCLTDQTMEFSDISDGLAFKGNRFFQDNPKALRLVLYQDAFEVCNPLGSSRKVHKLVGIYFQIANVAPHNRSKVEHIQLVALCFERDVNRFGFSKIFHELMKDLSCLQNDGVTVNVNMNDSITLKASLIAVVGDNLGSHQVGGFVENFSASQYFCRYCHITKSDIDVGDFYGFPFRNVESYESDIVISSITGENSRGIKHNSVLNRLDHFHVCNPGLPPCLGHDLFEGIIQQDLMLAINYFVVKKFFTYEDLNAKLQNLRFKNESVHENIPKIKKGDKLVGNASENMRLLLILPFALYDVIDITDCVWQMIVLLRKICSLILSVHISIGQVALLQTSLYEYIDMRKTLFPNNNMLRKHHYIMHYPKLIMHFGPLKHLKASEKLKIDGSLVVLECYGTLVDDDDDVLRLLQKDVLLLLTKSQTWEPVYEGPPTPRSHTSTLTISTYSPSRSPMQEVSDSESNRESTLCDETSLVPIRVSEATWKDFPLPLHRLSKAWIEECLIGNRSNKQAITEVVHVVVDAVRDVKMDAPSSAFKYLARKLVDKYPNMFEDRDEDGFIIGNGAHSIYSKLQERNNYLNRPHKRISLKSTLHITPKQRKLILTAKAGCSKCQPDSHSEQSEDALKKYIEFLKLSGKEKDLKISDPEVLTALTNTYAQQRLFLNNPSATPTIDDIPNSWPILLTSEGMYWHYTELMQHCIHEMTKALHTKVPKILEFGVFKKLLPRLPEEHKYLEAIKLIAQFFKENINVLIFSANEDPVIPTNLPCILLKSIKELGAGYAVFVEKQEIETFTVFEDSLEFTFAAYYVFNMAYPKEVGCELEFIQRYFLKINPDIGSKNKSKKSSLKIIALINSLRKM